MFCRATSAPVVLLKRLTRHLSSSGSIVYCIPGSKDVLTIRPWTYSLFRLFSSAYIKSESADKSVPKSDSAKKKRYRSITSQVMSYTRSFNVPVTHDPKTEQVEMEHPGLSYESVDSNGNPKLWSLLNLLVSGRFYAYHTPVTEDGNPFLEYDVLTSDRFTFMVTTEVNINRSMYKASIPKNPMPFQLKLGYVGNTSLNTVAILQDKTRQHTLMTNINQVVSVDKVTRRPLPIPDWWRQRYAWAATRKEPLRFPVIPIPESPAPEVYRVTVAWSDTDMYKHTNFASYIRYCIDAIHSAVGQPGLATLTEDVIRCGVQYVRMSYSGESVVGDGLEVKVWECENEPTTTVNCDIHKTDDPTCKTIFQCKLKFFEREKPQEKIGSS